MADVLTVHELSQIFLSNNITFHQFLILLYIFMIIYENFGDHPTNNGGSVVDFVSLKQSQRV
jgi:hypothetical protein